MINFIKKKIKWFVFLILGGGLVFAAPLDCGTGILDFRNIDEKLVGKTTQEKAYIKSCEIAKLDLSGEYVSAEYEVKIDIQSIEQIEDGVTILFKAWKDDKPLGFGKDGTIEIERVNIHNPPILVGDSNGEIVREWTDRITGELKQRKLREDPAEAIRQVISHNVTLIGKDGTNIVKGKVGNTHETYFPAAGANSPVDGYVNRNAVDEVWADIRTGAGNASSDTATGGFDLYFQASASIDQWRWMSRAIFLFNTASIGSDVVDSAIFSIWGHTSKIDNFSQSVSIASSTPANNDALVDADYGQIGTTKFATDITIASWNISGYNAFTLNAVGIAAINTGGITKFGAGLSGDIGDVEPTWSSLTAVGVRPRFADQSGTSEDPKLVVVHSEAVSAEEVSNSQGYEI